MSPSDPNSDVINIEAQLPFELKAHWGGEIKLLMACEPSPSPSANSDPISAAIQAQHFWNMQVKKARWFDPEKECFIVLCLDRKNRVKAWNLVSLGTATATLAHPREVFRPALVAAATAIIVMHNHPTGDPTPSQPDRTITAQLREAARFIDIEFQDHIIVGSEASDPRGIGFYSLREEDEHMRAENEARWHAEYAARKEARKQAREAKRRAKAAPTHAVSPASSPAA
jgi:hypothetical protein